MAIVQKVTYVDAGLSFNDWVASLAGAAKTAAEAAIADNNAKFSAQVAAGNVYVNANGERVWASTDAEQAFIDNMGLEYGALWDQWKAETGGSVEVVIESNVAPARLVKPMIDWAKDTLTEAEFNNFSTDKDAIAVVMAGRQRDDLTPEEIASIRADYPNFTAVSDAYKAHVASL